MTTPVDPPARATPPRWVAALAGASAGAAAVGVGELLAGLIPGSASPVVSIGDLVIALQPPGAKQLVVDLFGEADKVVLNLAVAGVAVAGAAALGILGRTRPRVATGGFVAAGALALVAGLRDPLAETLQTAIVVAMAVATAIVGCRWLLGLGGLVAQPRPVEMLAWERRRFLGASVSVVGVALASGVVGRALLDRGRLATANPQPDDVPAPVAAAGPLPVGADLRVEGVSPIVTPNAEFYRIDTALIVPRPNVATWTLRVFGRVDRPFELNYEELLAMPIHEQYVTIACVSNEVGGNLVGNALWGGVRLKELLERASIHDDATQIVGRAVDRFTVGFPTSWALADERESLVAVTMNGEPLPADHGYPARLIVPGLYGYVSATKWLAEIELTRWEDFDAYWVPLGWAKEAPILTQSRIDVPRDGARVAAGEVAIGGVAWAPDRGIASVEVQVDDAAWERAELSTPISDATWVQFVRRWEATSGEHTIRVRATDGVGDVQTDARTRPAPDGARGHHTIRVTVA